MNKLTIGSNLRWESSRMILPEHREQMLKQNEEKKKVKKPQLDEQAFEEIGIIVLESLNYTSPIKITIWQNGYFLSHIGIVSKVDYQMKYILLEQDDDEFERIFIKDITAVERI